MPRAGRRRERSLLVRRPENPKDLVIFREIEKPCVCVCTCFVQSCST